MELIVPNITSDSAYMSVEPMAAMSTLAHTSRNQGAGVPEEISFKAKTEIATLVAIRFISLRREFWQGRATIAHRH